MLKDQKAQDELTGGPIGKWTKSGADPRMVRIGTGPPPFDR